jgi:hypothetical protein
MCITKLNLECTAFIKIDLDETSLDLMLYPGRENTRRLIAVRVDPGPLLFLHLSIRILCIPG